MLSITHTKWHTYADTQWHTIHNGTNNITHNKTHTITNTKKGTREHKNNFKYNLNHFSTDTWEKDMMYFFVNINEYFVFYKYEKTKNT